MKTERYRLPDWLYNALPYAYIAAGVLVIIVLKNNWAIFSGVTLISAGAMVFAMRLKYRHALKKLGTSHKGFKLLNVKTGDSGSLQLVWSRKYECGNSNIDAQHRNLFKICNDLLAAMYDSKRRYEAGLLVNELHDDVKAHFYYEEKILDAWNHPLSEEHKRTHQSLLEKVIEIREDLKEGRLLYQEAINFFVNDLVLQHMMRDDKKFFNQI